MISLECNLKLKQIFISRLSFLIEVT